MSFSSLVTYLVTRSFNLPVLHLVQLLYNLTLATSNGFPTALMNTFVFIASSSNSYSSYNLPGDVGLHLVHLPVLHLLHLLFHHHLIIIQHLPNRQQPTLLSPPASDLTLNSTPDHVLAHIGHLPYDLVLHLVHLLVPDLLNNINHFPNNLQKQYYHHRQKLRP